MAKKKEAERSPYFILIIAIAFIFLIAIAFVNFNKKMTGNAVSSSPSLWQRIVSWFSSSSSSANTGSGSGSEVNPCKTTVGGSGSGSGSTTDKPGTPVASVISNNDKSINKPDTTQCSTSSIKYGICKSGECVPYSCDNVFGSGRWTDCPPKISPPTKGVFPYCCEKRDGEKCNAAGDWKVGDDAACCPDDTTADNAFGSYYCLKTQSWCDRLYGANSGYTPCQGICCKPGTVCKVEDYRPNCMIDNLKGTNCPTGTTYCKGFATGNLCCVNGKELCMNGDTGQEIKGGSDDKNVNCIPIPTGCKADEVYCPGGGNTIYKHLALCCPSGSKCAQHPDGTPNCVN